MKEITSTTHVGKKHEKEFNVLKMRFLMRICYKTYILLNSYDMKDNINYNKPKRGKNVRREDKNSYFRCMDRISSTVRFISLSNKSRFLRALTIR